MTRPIQHQIDERAKRVFCSQLRDSWVPREQNPDYRIDYTVEVFDGEESSGLFWHAQLKGTTSVKKLKTKPVVSFMFETEHLAYFVDKVSVPAYMVVVDTQCQEGWWVFLQQFEKEKLRGDWREKREVAIHLPLDNTLADHKRLRKSIVDATSYMRDLNPSSISAAIEAERSRIESLDERFEVSLDLSGDGIGYKVRPSEQVEFKIHATGDSAVAKLSQLYARGGVVEFDEGEADLAGLPDEFRKEWGLARIETGFRSESVLRLESWAVDTLLATLELKGEFHSGKETACFKHQLGDGLVNVKFELDAKRTEFPVDLSVDLANWNGKDIRWLQHLDTCLLYTSPSPRDATLSRMPSSA